MPVVYDGSFNKNEIYIIVQLIVGLALVWIFRKRFPFKELLVYFLYTVFTGMLFDHTISIVPFDNYDVNDSSAFEAADFLTYLSFGAYGYFFIYLYDHFRIKPALTPVYIFGWSLVSVAMEYLSVNMGVFHYKNGYTLYYSLPIYLLVLIPPILIYRNFNRENVKRY